MNLLRFVEDLIRLVVLGFLDFRRAGVRFVLLLALVAEVVVFVICADPTFPLWGGGIIPLVQRVFGSYYLHYPESFIGLPVTGAAGKIVVDLLVTPFVTAWCGLAVYRVLGEERTQNRAPARASAHYYWPLFLLTCVEIAVWILFYGLPVYLLNTKFHLPYKIHSMITSFGGLFPLLLLSPLYFVPAHLLREDRGLPRAIGASFRRARQALQWPVAFILLPWLAGLPLSLILQRSTRLAAQLRPEIILVVVAVQAAIFLLFGFLALDASIRIFLKPRSRGL